MLLTAGQANERLLCGDLIYDDTVMQALRTSGNRERHLMRHFA
jgi:hypothetical protein